MCFDIICFLHFLFPPLSNGGAASVVWVLLKEMRFSSCNPCSWDSQAFSFPPPWHSCHWRTASPQAARCWVCNCQRKRTFPFYVSKVTNTLHHLLLQKFNSIKGENLFVWRLKWSTHHSRYSFMYKGKNSLKEKWHRLKVTITIFKIFYNYIKLDKMIKNMEILKAIFLFHLHF